MNNQPASAHALYRFYAADGSLLYVGMTINPSRRFEKHRGDKAWWKDIARIDIQHFADLAALKAAERDAIKTDKPRHNIRMNGDTSHGENSAMSRREAEQAADKGLVDKWFHSWEDDDNGKRRVCWQGQILARITRRQFLVETYSWWDGTPCKQELVALATMDDWTFYENHALMQIALGCREHFSGPSAQKFNGGSEGCCGRPVTHKTGTGYACSRCAKFYAQHEPIDWDAVYSCRP